MEVQDGAHEARCHDETVRGWPKLRRYGSFRANRRDAHFALDPTEPLNQVITDIDLAPRGDDGRVHFSADFLLLRPQDLARRNRRLLFDVLNRGRPTVLRMTDIEPAPVTTAGGAVAGDGWLLRRGYTLAWCGWQHDVLPGQDLIGMSVPEAQVDGRPVTGTVLCDLQPEVETHVMLLTSSLRNAEVRCYPTVDVDDRSATLTERDTHFGSGRVIDRDRWAFATLEGERTVPDPTHVYLADGFRPGKLYEVVYTALGAPLVGLGLAAARDVASFLRYATADAGNPAASGLDFAYAFGASQSGRFLRQLLYLGLCEDEGGRPAFDGIHAHIAGARFVEANYRFAQPGYLGPYSPINLFPFTDALQTEPATGRSDGVQSRAVARGVVPKVVYTNSSFEYWGSQAALVHTALDGKTDAPVPDNVRIYHLTGTQHGGQPLPLTDTQVGGGRALHFLNSVDYKPLVRGALANLDAWVSRGDEPPPSRHARVGEGTAVPRESLRESVARIPGVRLPTPLSPVGRLDFGPDMEQGRATRVPPELCEPYPDLVSALDDDGNEVAGVRLPDVAVPLATYTGWNVRHPEAGGAGQPLFLAGATLVFPRTAAERQARGDPRPAIAERYASKDAYLERARACAEDLVRQRYLVGDDIEPIVAASVRRWDEFTA